MYSNYDEWKLASPPEAEPIWEEKDMEITVTFTLPLTHDSADPDDIEREVREFIRNIMENKNYPTLGVKDWQYE
jgi:hypothetical protein